MIHIKENVQCCGCNACGDICSKRAITFNIDKEGFWYPEVNLNLCTDCGLCEIVCPVLNSETVKKGQLKEPKSVIANHKNIEVRFDSASGGMFTAYAECAFKNAYYVGGAIFTDNWGVINYVSNNREDLLKLRNSKYIQADAQGFYKQVKELLQAGEKVLICNLPCQIAALKNYLHKDYENLITVDLFCKGINSPKVFRKFLDSLEKKYESEIMYIKPKSKDLGWHNLTLKIVFKNGQTYYGTKDTDFFTKAFIYSNCITRPSCYNCKYKGFPRVADLSIGDYWRGRNSKKTSLDDNLGTSSILINNEKGEQLMSMVSKQMSIEKVGLNDIVSGNPALIFNMPKEKINRDVFYEKLDNENFIDVINYLEPKGFNIKRKGENVLKCLYYQVVKYAQFHPKPIAQFIWYNFFCKEVHNTSLFDGRLIFFTRFCDFELSKGSRVSLKGSIVLGSSVFRHSHKETRVRVMSGGKLIIDGDWSCGDGANIEVFSTGELIIKRGPWANVNLTIICMDRILLDEWAMIGRDVTIRDNNGNHPIGIYGSRVHMPIVIGKHAWLTSNCTIMQGVRVGDGTIIGSDALVTSSIPANCVANGSPAKVTQKNILWRM